MSGQSLTFGGYEADIYIYTHTNTHTPGMGTDIKLVQDPYYLRSYEPGRAVDTNVDTRRSRPIYQTNTGIITPQGLATHA